MQDADLFMGLTGIAGVFVGFGALIAVRSGGPTEAGPGPATAPVRRDGTRTGRSGPLL